MSPCGQSAEREVIPLLGVVLALYDQLVPWEDKALAAGVGAAGGLKGREGRENGIHLFGTGKYCCMSSVKVIDNFKCRNSNYYYYDSNNKVNSTININNNSHLLTWKLKSYESSLNTTGLSFPPLTCLSLTPLPARWEWRTALKRRTPVDGRPREVHSEEQRPKVRKEDCKNI